MNINKQDFGRFKGSLQRGNVDNERISKMFIDNELYAKIPGLAMQCPLIGTTESLNFFMVVFSHSQQIVVWFNIEKVHSDFNHKNTA